MECPQRGALLKRGAELSLPASVQNKKDVNVRGLVHRELVEAIHTGQITEAMYKAEMMRRKTARMERRMLMATHHYRIGPEEKRISLNVEVVESGEEILELPMSKEDIMAMNSFFSHNKPYWDTKMKFYARMMEESDFVFKVNAFINTPYTKGTVEYFTNVIWGSRRMRERFMEHMEQTQEIAEVQCVEQLPERLIADPDLFIVFDEHDFDDVLSMTDSESTYSFWSDSETEFDEEMEWETFWIDEYQMSVLEDHDFQMHVENEYELLTYSEHIGEIYADRYATWDDMSWFDYAMVQSDEPVLEEEATIAGHKNITFIEEREVDSDSSHLNSSISSRDRQMNMAETPWSSIASILEREIIVKRGTWNETQRGEVWSIGIPKCFVTGPNNFIKQQLQLMGFLRSGAELRIQFNGNKFAAGSMVFALLPPMFEEDAENYIPYQCFNWPHIRIDASVSNVGTLFVPFTHILSHFPQRAGSLESDSIVTLGRLVAYVINPLRVGEGASNNLSYTVYGRLVNPEVHQTTWPITDFAYSDGLITQAAEEGLFKKVIGGGLSTALGSFLSKMTGGLATGLGSLLTGLIFDYPHDPMPPEVIVNTAMGPVCYGAGVDHSIRLALTPVSQTETSPDLLGSSNGDFDLKTLLQIPSLLETNTWTEAMQPGERLFFMPVTPTWLSDERVTVTADNTCEYAPTMLAYIARTNCLWRGSHKLKIQFIKTAYNSGRVLVAFTPHMTVQQMPTKDKIDTLEYYNQSNAVVIDIEEQQEVVIDLPYMSPRPWLRCDAFRTGYDFVEKATNPNTYESPLGESYCGIVQVFVLNRLVSPSNVPQNIDVNFFIYAGDDFELAYPTTLFPLNIRSFGQGSFGGYQEYPFQLTKQEIDPVYATNYENQEYIKALYFDGKALFEAGKIKGTSDNKWYKCVVADYIGTTDDETLVWAYKVSLMNMYFQSTGVTTVQERVMSVLPMYKAASVQAVEEYTTGRQKEPMPIVATAGKRTCEAAPSTVSENAMNLQTLLRRFYCIYNSVPLYSDTSYTCISVPINPSFVPIVRYPVRTTTFVGYGEPLPIDHVAWFTKLYTYWRGSMRYKLLFDQDSHDVIIVHVPTECRTWSVRNGIKEIDIQRLLMYAGAVAVSQVQGGLEVEVPYASPYNQLFVDVHNKYFDLRCQNGTMFVFFRNKTRDSSKRGLTFSLFRSTGEDFVFNLLKTPPLVEEPQMSFGYCEDKEAKMITLGVPEAARSLGNKSQKVPLPGGTGFKKIDDIGHFRLCIAKPADKAEAQMFESVTNAITSVQETHTAIQDTAIHLNSAIKDANLTETLQNLNSVSRKLDSYFSVAESTAKNLANTESVKKYALIASEVVLCGTFVHQLKVVFEDPTLPNFITLGVELGLIVGLTVSETLQSLIMRVVDWAMNIQVLKPEQARAQAFDGATDFLDENCTTICSVVAVIGTVFYAYLFGALPSFERIKEVVKNFFETQDDSPAKVQNLEKVLGFSLKNAHFSILGLSALEKVYNKILEWARQLVFWFLDKENPEVIMARSAVDVKDRVLNLIQELDDLDYEPNFIAALEDPLVHNRFYQLQDEIYALTSICTSSKIDQRVVTLLTECRRRASALVKRMEKERCTATSRYDPFVVCIHGETGVGKTKFARKVFKTYQKVMGLSDTHLLYCKNIRDDYWSGYTNQPLVLWDEYGQSKEADKVAIPEFMTLRGDKPVQVNMAHLDDKGRDFTSQGIILTTNVPYQTYNSVRDNDAHMRRRHFMIGMQHRQGFDANVLQNAEFDAFPNWEHCSFAITSNVEETIIERNLTMDEILSRLEERMTHWHNNQLARLAEEQIAVPPRGIIPNPAIQPVDLEIENDVFSDASSSLPTSVLDEAAALVDDYLDEMDDAAIAQSVELMEYFVTDPELILTENERFMADMFLARCGHMRKDALVRTYLRAKFATQKKASKLYDLANRTFLSLVDKVKQFWNNNPKLCKILGVLTLLGGVGAIMHFRTKREVENYESGPARPAARRVIAEGHYESGPTRPVKTRVIAEGSEDIQATEISRKVAQYVYPVIWREGSTRAARLNCVHIGGHIILVPYHFFNHAKDGEFFEVRHRVHPVIIEFRKENMYNLQDKDWALYNCGVRLEAAKQIHKFFIDENNLGKVKQANCMLLTRDFDTTDVMRDCGFVTPQQAFRYDDDRWKDTYVQTGWKHNLNTTVGQCGGPLVVCSNVLPSPGKLGGIHVAGFKNKSVGYAILITRQMLERGLQKFGLQPGEAPVPQGIEVGLSPKLRIVPDGDFTIVGCMPNSLSPAQPMKTTFVETPFQHLAIAELGPIPKIPAKLRPFENEQGERISPLKKAIVKYGHMTIPFSSRNVKKVETYLVHMFDQKLTKHTGRRVFSEPEAVNGLPGVAFAEKMNMKSSAGWPYQMEDRKPGKWHLFDAEGNIVDARVKQRLFDRREAAKHLQRVPSVWRDCMKDELRPVPKVMAGKTRLFTIAPVDFTILTRQMFLDFVMAFYSAYNTDFFSSVGINPESVDWTELYNYLAEYNSQVIAGDYECFDGKEMPEIMMAVCNVINAWYGDSTENQNIRETLFLEMIHTMQLCENLVYMTHQGNPSGNPLTTVINTIVNVYLLVLTWMEIFPDKTVDDFFSNVRVKAYGDDNLIAPKQKYLERFNQNTIAEALLKHNIVYTSESKSGAKEADSRPLSEVSFLKRGFRKDKEFGNLFKVPTMSRETLNSYLYFYRFSTDAQEQIQENQRSALLFASFHGRKFYDEYLEMWKRFMKESSMESLQISFDEYVDIFKWGAGMLENKPHVQPFNTMEIETESMEGFMKVTNSKPMRVVSGALQAPFYYLAASLGLCEVPNPHEPTDDRWAVAIPSGEGKSTLARLYPWLFVDHDDLLLPLFKDKCTDLPWKAEIARKHDFPASDRRILLVHHPTFTTRKLVGSFIAPIPTFIRTNCLQRLAMHKPLKMDRNDRNIMLVQLCSELEPRLVRSGLKLYTHPPSGGCAAENAQQ